jgi:hypothetical protein
VPKQNGYHLQGHGQPACAIDTARYLGVDVEDAVTLMEDLIWFVRLSAEGEEPEFYLTRGPLSGVQTCAVPPSTKTSAPVMKLLSLLARNRATAAAKAKSPTKK